MVNFCFFAKIGHVSLQIRDLLSRYGEIDRIYLQPEDAAAHKRRKRAGGNRKLNYTEGWIEFKDKRSE
jgi:ESF2/ABP1 family protein